MRIFVKRLINPAWEDMPSEFVLFNDKGGFTQPIAILNSIEADALCQELTGALADSKSTNEPEVD